MTNEVAARLSSKLRPNSNFETVGIGSDCLVVYIKESADIGITEWEGCPIKVRVTGGWAAAPAEPKK